MQNIAANIAAEIDKVFEDTPEKERDYIGASTIGQECQRRIWLEFNRFTFPENFSGRMRRLFQRGQREEFWFQEMLRLVGFEIESSCIEQTGFKSGFFGGHADGVLTRDGYRYLAEYKTHNDKSFKVLKLDGVKESKPAHYTQMMIYAKQEKTDFALYCAVNKNDDELHFEVLPRDDSHANKYINLAHDLAASYQPPEKIARTPSDYRCKMCHAAKICHGLAPARIDCRNCTNASRDALKGTFSCDLGHDMKPCADHCFNPLAMADFYALNIEGMDQETKTITFINRNGQEIKSGSEGLASDEFLIKVL